MRKVALSRSFWLPFHCFAFGTFWAAYYLLWQNDLTGTEVTHYASRVAEIAAFLALAIVYMKFPLKTKTLVFSALCLQALSVLLMFIPAGGALSAAMSGLFGGAAAAALVLSTVQVFSLYEPRISQFAIVLSFLFGHALSAVIPLIVAENRIGVVRVALLLFSTVLLFISCRRRAEPVRQPEGADVRKAASNLKPLLIGMTLFSLMCGTITQVFLEHGLDLGVGNIGAEIATIVALVLLLCFAAFQHTVTIETALLVVLPVFALVFLLVSLVFEDNLVNAGIIVRVGLTVYQVMIWALFAKRGHANPLYVSVYFGLAYALLRLCVLLGRLAGHWIAAQFGIAVMSGLVFSIVAFWLLVVTFMLFFLSLRRKEYATPSMTESEREKTIFEARCHAFAERFGLSSRETEILGLFIHGRSAIHIAKSLFLSESTVRTHLRRLYSKADVHSRQELLDVFETLPIESGAEHEDDASEAGFAAR